ncbi:MAG: NB-ARC domain-containing protein [Leptolyngbyaceae cyanobacterium bins.302]|nr:NB-ARC domain-containing protein [Leptolyngbyaceae cyanobacterium bins.302]
MTIEEALSVLDNVLGQVTLNDVQELVFRHAWEDWTYEQIAAQFGYTTDYVRNVGSQLWTALSEMLGVKVGKKNLQSAVRRWAQQHRTQLAPTRSLPEVLSTRQDLAEAPDGTNFTGRTQELIQLEQWIGQDRCRLIALLGMGGMGKTSLAARLVQQVAPQFEAIVWRSLRNAPPVEELLAGLLQFLTQSDETSPALSLDRSSQIAHLIEQLRQQRCLIVLDNLESVLPCSATSAVADNGYVELLEVLSDFSHQSCVVLTSREKPDEIAWKEGIALPVRSLQLSGMSDADVKKIFATKGSFTGADADWHQLVEHYAGNPLALKMVAAAVQELFNQDISEFLSILGSLVFDDIRDLLDRQFNRLSYAEKDVMFWLAINREVTSFTELRDDILCPIVRQSLPSTLRSLKHRFLIETTPNGFTQQPVVMEYVTHQLIVQASREIAGIPPHALAPSLPTPHPVRLSVPVEAQPSSSNFPAPNPQPPVPLLQTHALYKATAKDYIRDSQARLILAPLVERLLAIVRSPLLVEEYCRRLLADLWFTPQAVPGYGAGNLINLLQYLEADLTGLELSNLTIRQAQFQEATLHQVNLANATLERCVFLESLGTVWSVAFSPNGALLAASDATGDIHIWRVTDHQKVMTCQEHTHWVCAIAFSPDSKRLASGSAGNVVKLWNVATGQCLRTLCGHTEWVLALAFNRDGTLLATSSADRTIKLWNAKTGVCLQTLAGHQDWVGAIAFSPDGRFLISGSDDSSLKLWDVEAATCLQTLTGHSSPVRSVAFSPNGQAVASGGSDRTVKIWHLGTGCLRTLTGHSKPIRSVAYQSPEAGDFSAECDRFSQQLVTASEDGTLRLWDSQTGQCLKVLPGHTGHVRTVAIHPKGHLLASGSADQTVKLWNRETGHCLRTLRGYTNFALAVACAANYSSNLEYSPLIASGHSDRTVRVWNLNTGECLHTLKGHTNDVWSVAFIPTDAASTDRILASSSTDQTIRLWDEQTGRCLRVLRGHTDWIHAIAASTDGQTIASASSDQTIRLWDVRTGRNLHTLVGHQSHVWSVAFSPTESLLASSSDDQTIKLWDSKTGECIKTLIGHSRRIQAIAFSPDGIWLASASGDQTIAIWEVETGRCLRTLSNPGDHVRTVVFSPFRSPFFQQTGQLLLGSYAENTVKLWNAHTGELLHQLEGHRSRIWSVAFSPDGLTMISGSEDGTMRLWDTELGKCLSVLQSPRPYEEMNIAGVKGLTEAQKYTLKSLGAVE